MNTPTPGLHRPVRGGQHTLARTRILELRSVHYAQPARGTEADYTVIATSDWVNVVAVDPAGSIVLVRQFRYGVDEFSLEVPGGIIEPGEDPLAAGLRELEEETGYAGGRARLLGSVQPNPAIQNNRCHFVLVEGATPTGTVAWDSDEEIERSTAPVEEVLAWARSGRITHSLTICALFFYEASGRPRAGI
jgi:ADP-ribose pyrophosphatase